MARVPATALLLWPHHHKKTTDAHRRVCSGSQGRRASGCPWVRRASSLTGCDGADPTAVLGRLWLENRPTSLRTWQEKFSRHTPPRPLGGACQHSPHPRAEAAPAPDGRRGSCWRRSHAAPRAETPSTLGLGSLVNHGSLRTRGKEKSPKKPKVSTLPAPAWPPGFCACRSVRAQQRAALRMAGSLSPWPAQPCTAHRLPPAPIRAHLGCCFWDTGGSLGAQQGPCRAPGQRAGEGVSRD